MEGKRYRCEVVQPFGQMRKGEHIIISGDVYGVYRRYLKVLAIETPVEDSEVPDEPSDDRHEEGERVFTPEGG